MVETIVFSSFGIALLSMIGLMGYATVKQLQIKQKQLEIEQLKLENELFLQIEKKQSLLEEPKSDSLN